MKMKKYLIELKWALIFAAMTLAWMLLEKLLGLHDRYIDQHPTYTNLIAIPAILVYVLALLDKRKNFYGGHITYQQGVVSGLLITLVVTLLSPLTQVITSLVITPDYFANAIAASVKANYFTQAQAEAYFNLQNYVIQGLIGAPIMGTITTVIVAFFVKKA
jgi:hypothetical protein